MSGGIVTAYGDGGDRIDSMHLDFLSFSLAAMWGGVRDFGVG